MVRSASRPTGATSSTPTAPRSSGWATPGGWGSASGCSWPDEFRTLAEDRRGKGFTVIQIVAGLYPDMPAFDPRGKNEAGFPWTENYASIRPEYFDRADERINDLVDHGLVPCVVMAWGYHLPWTRPGDDEEARPLRHRALRCSAGRLVHGR